MGTFYHGTTRDNWEKIQAEGVLWGRPTPNCTTVGEPRRYTYLSPHLDVAQAIGDVILEVEYDPVGVGSGIDNFGFDPPPGQTCWQFSVFIPIPVSRCRVMGD